MILQALTDYYEKLADKGEVGRSGWGLAKVSYAIEINDNGTIIGIYSLMQESQRGKTKKMVSREMNVPMPVKRSVNVSANFLCDGSAYFLGICKKGDKKRIRECFKACKNLHLSLLEPVDSPAAHAVCKFFERWDPQGELQIQGYEEEWENITDGSNIIFYYDGKSVIDDKEIRLAWQRYYSSKTEGSADSVKMCCLITGTRSTIAATHPAIKGVYGAQSSGANIVSFNSPAACSYDREQNFNAPVSEYAAFAYTTALNYLIADFEHRKTIGDTTVVCWAQNAQTEYQDAAIGMMDGVDDSQADAAVRSALAKLARGENVQWNGAELDPEMKFYVLGLAPNAARVSVRFFLQNSFGKMMTNLKAHYDRLEISKPSFEQYDALPLWRLLSETVNPNSRDKASSPQLSGDMLRSVLLGTPYPATLLNAVELRIRAESKINYGKASIIKAYYLKNENNKCPKEVLTVALNESSNNTPYVLGRLFSILEQVQEAALPGINATIRDKYFNSAAATPAQVFPVLINLAQKHLRKLEEGKRIWLEKQMQSVIDKLNEEYPSRLGLPEQGAFQLGYYHQTQKRYEKKGE